MFAILTCSWVLRCLVVSDSVQPHGLQPSRLLCPWNFPGKNTRGGCHFLLQEIFLTQGLDRSSCISCIGRQIPYHCTTWEAHSWCSSGWRQMESLIELQWWPWCILVAATGAEAVVSSSGQVFVLVTWKLNLEPVSSVPQTLCAIEIILILLFSV